MGESERELTLLHLRKTFSEYCRVPLTGADANTDRKFDRVLPLFCKVMTMYPCATDIVAQFKEICSFSGHLCRHLVQEMRVRAAELSTDHAALHIATFLSPVTNDSRGWLLLQSAHYLVSTGHLPVIDAVCKASLPSTLVKALYLFFDLPSTSDQKIIELRRMVFNRFLKISNVLDEFKFEVDEKNFLQLMEKLCEYKCVGEELARKDDLFLLFVGACCTCPVENVAWRKAASQLLVTLISKALTPAVIKYIHGKQCIAHFLSNISNEDAHLSVQERVEMIICLLCVIKDSASLTPVILQDFQQFNGYTILKQFVLKYSFFYEYEEDGIRNVLLMLMSVVTSGLVELRPLSSPSLVVLPSFTLPSPSGNGLSVRNLDAFRLLFQIFVECKNERICETVIDVVHNIYASDSANYFIIDRECSLAQFVENMHSKGTQVQRKILELLEYVVFHLNHVPCKELIALSVLLKTHTAAGNLSCCELSLQSAFRILSANTILKDAFREVGLVETFTWIMIHYVTLLKEQTLSDEQARIALLSTDILALSISGNNNNSRVFRESAGSKLLVDLICIDNGEWRASALQLIKQLLILAHSEEQLAALLMILHAPPNDSLELKSVILKSLLCVLRESHKVRVMFRRVGGYLCLISLLLSVEAKLHEPLQWHQDKPKTQSQQALATSSSESQPQVDESISAVANASVTSDQKLFKQQQPTAATNDNESTIRSDNIKGKENIYERNDNIDDDDNDNNNNGTSDDDETNKLPQDCLGLLEFMHIIFKVLTISMRYEPSNAKYFSSEVKWDNLCIALRASGAFDDWSDCVQSASLTDEEDIWRSDASTLRSRIAACHRVFQHCEQIHSCTRPARMPASVFFACCILRFLFNMALDNYEKFVFYYSIKCI
ncbi:unnamed protein product [Anisakis simplex]|uniref:WD repeat and FYVE domain-containing protein 3 n=1 Tax=Anisakis simplex TaxID=6269 RepID=A0A158PNU4_ANISI|nr:unnamed protein product [Anisakis simplex]